MHRRMGFGVALAVLMATAAAGERLTNADVVAWQQAGLGEAVMLAKIRSAPAAFDTGTPALVALKAAGVSDQVIAAMVEAAAVPVATAEMEMLEDGSGQPMTAVSLSAEASSRKDWIPYYNGAPETFFFFEGPHAARRTGATRPTFSSSLPPERVKLVHLGHHEGRKTRFVVFEGARSDRVVALGMRRLDDGRYEYRPQAALQPGEYALMVSPDLENDSSVPPMMRGMMGMVRAHTALYSKAYDFAVSAGGGSAEGAAAP